MHLILQQTETNGQGDSHWDSVCRKTNIQNYKIIIDVLKKCLNVKHHNKKVNSIGGKII